MAARAFVLNLDADLELAVGAGYTRSRAVAARLPSLRATLGTLLGPDDVVVDDDPAAAAGLPGHAFCMTPFARAALEAAGAIPVAAPPFEVIRRVNHRRFCAELGQYLPGAVFATTMGEVERAVAAMDAPRGALLKRPFGFAGRGQRPVSKRLGAEDRAWLEASPIGDGVQVEPRVEIEIEHSVHGVLTEGGEARIGDVVIQVCDDKGAWLKTRAATSADLTAEELERAALEARRVADALAAASYSGPFGVDGFVYRGKGGARCHQPRGEINARYTMGWSVG